MPRLRQPRKGKKIQVKGRPLRFSYWPVYRGQGPFGLQSSVFAIDPWTIINASIKKKCPGNAKAEAHAYIEQARDFYKAAVSAEITAARPLLLYYCFLNLAKAFILTKGHVLTLDQAQHGISEKLRSPGRQELIDAYLSAFISPNTRRELQIFDEFHKAIMSHSMPANMEFDLLKLLPQVVPGHRLWAEAAHVQERFIYIHDIEIMSNESHKTMWLNIYIFADDLSRLGISHAKLLSESRLSGYFRQVTCNEKVGGRRLICLEQIQHQTYTMRPSDVVLQLVGDVKKYLWSVVASTQPYRRYYLYLSPVSEVNQVLPQLLSIYAITFYLGSITRYRPHHFDKILESGFGPRVEEFISGQPLQLIYLMASEFAEREVVRPAIV